MGFLHQAVNVMFAPAIAAGKILSAGGKKVESVFDGIVDTIASIFETAAGLIIIGGVTVVLLLAKNPRLALLAL